MDSIYKVSLKNLLFYIALIIYLSYQFWENTLFSSNVDVSNLRIIIFFIVSFILFLKFCIDKSYKRVFLFLAILAVFIWIGLNVSNIRELILTIFFIFEARNIEFKNIIKIFFQLLLIYSIITVFASLIGIFDANRTFSNRERSYLGFLWVTYGPNIFITIVLSWACLQKKGKKSFYTLICFFLINIFYFIETDTRAIFVEILLLFVLIVMVNRNFVTVPKKRLFKVILLFIFPLMALLTIFLSLFYGSIGWIQNLNALLSNRLNYNALAFARYPVTLFGNVMSWNMAESAGRGYFYVDSSYIQILLEYGVIAFVIILVFFTLLMRYYINSNNTMGIICLVVIAIHSITDPQLFILMYNPFLLAIGQMIYGKINRKDFIYEYKTQ